MEQRSASIAACLVALISTESVSITLSWPLLPPEVRVNRHGQLPQNFFPGVLVGNLQKFMLVKLWMKSLLLGYEIVQAWLKHCCSPLDLDN